MIRMILADDEAVITRGIRKLLDWGRLGIEIIGEYEDGRKALEAIVKERPDIALLDISMPGLSGVEILKECRAMENRVSVIFISGFQDFEYAKAALEYGAVAYLLKPVIREELLRAVEKSIRILRGEDGTGKEQEEEGRQGAVDYGVLMEDEGSGYTPVYADVMYRGGENEQMRRLISFSLTGFLEEYLNETGKGIVFQKEEKTAVILKGTRQEKIRPVVEELWAESGKATGHVTFFVIGDAIHSMQEIPDMFYRCLERGGYLFFADQMPMPVIGLHGSVFAGRGDSALLGETRQKLFEAIVAQNGEAVKELGERYGKLVCRLAEGKKEDACFYYCTAVRFLEEKCMAMDLPGRNPEMKDLLERGRRCVGFGEMAALFAGEFGQYLEGMKSAAATRDKSDIWKAREYIETHYMENLSLHVLAEEIHMNSYYFSAFFKKNTGENFKDYVNRVRIEHAVPLLISTDMKTYEIAENVGFGDIRVFNSAFQKMYRETPGNYRKRVREGKGDNFKQESRKTEKENIGNIGSGKT